VHISEIPELLEGHIDGYDCEIYEKTGLPKGMIEGTTPENFIVNRGGWNCGHELIPVDELTVPKVVRDRIANNKPYIFDVDDLKNNRGFTNITDGITSDDFDNIIKGFNVNEFDDDMMSIAKKWNIIWGDKEIFLSPNRNIIDIDYYTPNGIALRRRYTNGVVSHELFKIPEYLNMQGKGFSKEVFQALYKQYQNAGIERIKVHANLDKGGYTWARYGFSANKNEYGSITEWAKKKLSNGSIIESEYNDFTDWISKYKGKDIPLYEVSRNPYFKEMMMYSDWSGYLNFNDEAQKKFFEDYLFTR